MNPGRFLGENRQKISRVSGEALCKALVQIPRACGEPLVNGSQLSARVDLAHAEADDAKAPGQQKPRSRRGVMLFIDCRWLRCRHRLNLHYHLYEVFGIYPCLINSTIKAKAKINSTFCFHSSNAEILLSKYFDDKKSR